MIAFGSGRGMTRCSQPCQIMKFWTAVHEMGHSFNLAHSWQKALGQPWIPLSNEPEARSYMNYPFRVDGGQSSFFADFEYRFSDSELLFMRHAPARFRLADLIAEDLKGVMFDLPVTIALPQVGDVQQ